MLFLSDVVFIMPMLSFFLGCKVDYLGFLYFRIFQVDYLDLVGSDTI